MQKEYKGVIKVILFALGVMLLCSSVFYLVDTVFNGVVLDWIEAEFVIKKYVTDDTVISKGIHWEKIKKTVYWILVCSIWFFVALICIIIKITKESAEDKYETKLKELQIQMERKEELLAMEMTRKNDMIAYLAHDLKTPLTSVIGYLSLLEEAPDMPEKQKAKYVKISLDKALRLEQLVNEFFEITRYNFSEIVLEREQIDLSYMLLQLAEEFYPILQERGNTVRVEADDNLTVFGDGEKLARVFGNILKNAVAYSYQNTEIIISGKSFGHRVVVSIQNQGKTIPKEKLDTIFEKFFRLDEARTANSGGAGLGLAIAKEIVRLHGGTIEARSENGVTEFNVELFI